MSQPALTQALLKLESEVGGALIRREGKHTHLTPFKKMMRQQFELLAEADKQTHQMAQCEFRSMFLEACKEDDLSARSSILCENDQWIQSLIRIGAGVSIMPEESVIIDGVATTAVEGDNLHRSVSLVVATGREDTEDICNFMQAARAYSW